ncbi:GntR family transcriptional regulator [Shouchella shacheensis]|uniref:GntR family transcriptional regulator n=1 Tax=Shouchella shacheensis TaxID=1649580 RepID=UPI00073FDEF4|nr:GntR family transcriptional regulator [Shouchella shacheensis]
MISITGDKETQIIDHIMEKIISKSIEPEEKLPSENKLAQKYDVPRMTARKALTILEERGYIYSKQGKGRFLKQASRPIQLNLTGNTSFTDKMKQAGYDLTTTTMYCEPIAYDKKVFDLLQAGVNDSIYKIGRLRYIDREPIAIHQSFVSEAKFPTISDEGPGIVSMFDYYRSLGYKAFTSNQTFLSITFPTSDEQQQLVCGSMVPLIVVESDCLDAETNERLEHTKILYRSDKFKYDITMKEAGEG